MDLSSEGFGQLLQRSFQVSEKPFGYVVEEQVVAPILQALSNGSEAILSVGTECLGSMKKWSIFEGVKNLLTRLDESFSFPQAEASWIPRKLQDKAKEVNSCSIWRIAEK